MARGSGQLADPVQGLSQHGALLLQDAAMVAQDLGQRVMDGADGGTHLTGQSAHADVFVTLHLHEART